VFYVLIVGAGMGGIFAPVFSTVARWFSKKRGMMTGIVIAGGGTGGIIVPPVVNWLITSYGWRQAYIVMGSAVLVIIIAMAQFLRRDPATKGLLPDGEKNISQPELVWAAEGLSLEEAVRTRQYWMMVAMVACSGFGVMTVAIHIVPHVTDLGISSALASGVLAVMGGALVTGGILFGFVADRIGTRQTYMICFLLMAAALFWLMTAGEIWMFYVIAVTIGLANGGGSTLESPFVAELFGMKSHGLLLGTSEFCFTIGAASGPFVAGYLFDFTGSYRQAFMVGIILAIVGLIMAATLRPATRS
jgi:MFS family permease